MSLFEGYTLEQSDAVSAYTQSFLKGKETWISLPRERWPTSWNGMRNPVCPLVLNLYGHPQAGNNWMEDCEALVLQCGWKNIDNWPLVYWHEASRALMVVYVDDFKIAAPKQEIAKL